MRARLTLESGDASPRHWQLDGTQIVKLGRNRENHIILRDQHASRWHAEIYRDGSRWFLRDTSTNGTRLNGRRINGIVPLDNGCEIRVGDIRIRFDLEPSESPTDELEALPIPEPSAEVVEEQAPSVPQEEILQDSTILEPDELTALLSFMDTSLRETTASGVVHLALRAVHRHIRPTVSGFLSLDDSDALPRLVLPEDSSVDIHLSRQLTQLVQGQKRTAWMARPGEGSTLSTDSLVSYQDAICVPVHGEDGPLGALHVYRTGGAFTEREVRFCEVLAGYLARCLHVLRARCALEADNSRLRFHAATGTPQLIGTSPPMELLKQHIHRLARAKVVLIHGESGAGKELVAQELHRQSDRREGPLVVVNCAAIPSTLYEAELFGHCKGAFTGAVDSRPGFFQQADLGTLFLDEIGELPEDCQAKLLRVLEGGTFRPVGARNEMKADVRIIAATNRDLKQECLEGRFRKDLFFRLGLEIRVPPLRDRRDDIPALVKHFVSRLAIEYRRTVQISPEAMRRLQDYHWPGNVRQLRTVLEYAIAMSENGTVEVADLHLAVEELPSPLGEVPSLNLEELEAWAIRQALARTEGTITQAARLLGIHRDTLVAKMGKYGIQKG